MTKAHEFFEGDVDACTHYWLPLWGSLQTDAEARRVDLEVRSGIAKFSAAHSG